MSTATFHILLSLAGEARHGYAIMREIEERTAGKVRIGPGTLYGAIQRLVEDELVEEVEEAAGGSREERRRYYRLTRGGRKVLAAEASRMRSLVRMAVDKGLLRSEV
jgi:DNA-binding PadR family transcriptional regulator